MSHKNNSRFSNAIIQIGIKFIYVGIELQCKKHKKYRITKYQ